MLKQGLSKFLHDEDGSYTLWSLTWFMVYVGIGGLAVDATDVYRHQNFLQATADSAALAGVMSIDDPAEATNYALAFAENNMQRDTHGNVLTQSQVEIGSWNESTRKFHSGHADPDAIYVTTRRTETNENALGMIMLRFLGLVGLDPWWNVNAEAVAVKYIPDCLTQNGLIAFNKVDLTSNNTLQNICVHGENKIKDSGHDYAFEIQNNGTVADDVQISMPNLDDMIDRSTICSNDGLCEPDVLVEGDLMPSDAFLVDQAIAGLQDPDSFYAADYVIDTDGTGLPQIQRQTISHTYTGPLAPGILYYVDCGSPGNQYKLPDSGTQPLITDVVIVSECRIGGGSGTSFENVVMASMAEGNGSKPYDQNAIHLPNVERLGAAGNCTRGVRMYSASSIFLNSVSTINGAQLVARGNIEFTAGSNITGISAQAGQDISATANGTFEYCPIEGDNRVVWRYRLVE